MICLFRRLKLCVRLETLNMLMCLKTCCIATTRKLYLGRFPVRLYWVLWIWRSIIIYERRHDNVHNCSIIVCEFCQFKITSNWISLGAINLVPPSRGGRFIVSLLIISPKQLIFSFILLPTLSHTLSYQIHQEQEQEEPSSSFIFLILSFSSFSFSCMYVCCNISANW